MSLVYIIDGYNVIKRSSLFNNKKLKDARSAFLSYIDLYRPHGSVRNRVVVVFDGTLEGFSFKENFPFEVIFSQGETADEKIKKMVASFANPKNIVLVTDDKGLALSLRPHGVIIMGTTEFLNKNQNKKEKGTSLSDAGIELNIVQREKITEEMARLWLKKKS